MIKLAGRHAYGFQRLNPLDPANPRGTFNIEAGDFDKISLGDGHAIDTGFMERDFGSKSIGGFTVDANGDLMLKIGKNQRKTVNSLRKKGRVVDNYIHVDTPFDFNAPDCLNKFVKKIGDDFKKIGKGYDYVTPGADVVLAAKCLGPGSTEGDGPDPCPKSMGTSFRHLEVMPQIGWDETGYIATHEFTFGGKKKVYEVIDDRDGIDYGFNFEASSKRISSNKTADLVVNFYESETYLENTDRFIDTQKLSGGNERWYQVNRFDADEHVEVSASRNKYQYEFTDLSEHHTKYFKYHDLGFAWWDNNKFAGDLVKWFPDSEFETKTQMHEQLWANGDTDGDFSYKEHKAWAKFGNHVKGGAHPDYVALNGGCGASYTKAKDPNDPGVIMVDTAANLWVHKRGAGVRNIHNDVRTANPQPNRFALNICNCGNNQHVITFDYWNAKTDIQYDEFKLAGNNWKWHSKYTGEVNDRNISYTAAVNKHITTLNSDHAALIKDDQSDESAYKSTDYHLYAANVHKVLMNGNQDFFNYSNDDLQGNETIVHTEYSNNFEVSQNGFPVNRMKILNGSDLKYDNDKPPSKFDPPPESAKIADNELVIVNGGIGDPDPPTKGNLVGKYPMVAAVNTIKVGNGRNFQNPASSDISFDNGVGVLEGTNTTTFTNGSLLTSGSNIFKIANDGMVMGDDVSNAIILENDHQQQYVQLHDFWKKKSGDKEVEPQHIDPAIVINANGELREFASTNHVINAPSLYVFTQNSKFNTDAFNVTAGAFKVNSQSITQTATSMDVVADGMKFEGNNISLDASAVKVKRLEGEGTFNGHAMGSFEGVAGLKGNMYALDWPVEGSMPTVIMRHPVTETTDIQGISHSAEVDEIGRYSPNISNEKMMSKLGKTIAKMFNRFLNLELKMLDGVSSLKRK